MKTPATSVNIVAVHIAERTVERYVFVDCKQIHAAFEELFHCLPPLQSVNAKRNYLSFKVYNERY